MLKENLIAVVLGIVVIVVLVIIGIQILNIAKEIGADTKFGKITDTTPGILNRVTDKDKYKIGLQEEKSFERLLVIARISRDNLDFSKVKEIVRRQGLKGNPKQVKDAHHKGFNYVWKDKVQNLNFNEEIGSINYYYSQMDSRTDLSKAMESAEAEKLATGFLEAHQLKGDLEITQTSKVLISAVGIESAEEFSNGYKVVFSKKYKEYNIVGPSLEGYATVVMGNDRKVRLFSYLSPSEVLDEGVYPSESIGGAITKVKEGEAYLSKVEESGVDLLLSSVSISKLTISQVNLVYIDNPGSEYLQPYYQFKGTGLTSEGSDASVTLLVSAIKEKYLEIP